MDYFFLRQFHLPVLLIALSCPSFSEAAKDDCLSAFRKDWVSALPICEAQISRLEAEPAEDNAVQLTTTYIIQGYIHQLNDDFLGGKLYYKKAMATIEKTRRPNTYAEAAVFDRLGDIEGSRGNHDMAIKMYDSALVSLNRSSPSLDKLLYYSTSGELGIFPGARGPLIIELPPHIRSAVLEHGRLECPKVIINQHLILSLAESRNQRPVEKLYRDIVEQSLNCAEIVDPDAVLYSHREFTARLFFMLSNSQKNQIIKHYQSWLAANIRASHQAIQAARVDEHIMLGQLLAEDRRTDEARAEFRLAVSTAEADGDSLRDFRTSAYACWARFELLQGSRGESLRLFQKILDDGYFTRAEIDALPSSRPQRLMSAIPRVTAQMLYGAILSHPDWREAWQLALKILMQEQGRELDGARRLQHDLVYFSMNASQSDIDKERQQLNATMNDLILSGQDTQTPEEHQAAMQSLRVRRDALHASAISPFMRGSQLIEPTTSARTLKHVVAALPAGSSLIHIVRVCQPAHYLAFTLDPAGEVHAVDLGSSAAIDGVVSEFIQQVRHINSAFQRIAETAYQRIFAPLVPWLDESSQIYLILDGQISLMPFSALHDGDNYLLERFAFHYLNSGRDLIRVHSPPSVALPMILANPSLPRSNLSLASEEPALTSRGAGPCRLRTVVGSLRSLPGAEAEADEIARLLPESRLFKGLAATEAMLRAAIAPRILHLATHAEYVGMEPATAEGNLRQPRSAFRPLGPGQSAGSGVSQPERPSVMSCPMFDSAILLASSTPALAAQGMAASQDDGILTADEVRNTMNLWGTELVVLSGCKSGVGGVRPGEGVYGLRRAFFLAGAQSMVASLWSVDDAATRALMVSFYRHLLSGKPRGTALHLAMTETRARKAHPYYWAPFILIGRNDALASTQKAVHTGQPLHAPAGTPRGQSPLGVDASEGNITP